MAASSAQRRFAFRITTPLVNHQIRKPDPAMRSHFAMR
jgi:hypothetical protein